MNTFQIIMTVINVIAVITAPIVAVVIGQILQDRAEKRKDKMSVFKAIMTDRYGWSRETVLALNSIPIVFANDSAVRDAWKEYYKCLCVQEPDPMELKQRSEALYKLLENMASTLGYEGMINWDDIQNPYIPKGMASSFDNTITIQNQMAYLLQRMTESTVKTEGMQTGEAKNE